MKIAETAHVQCGEIQSRSADRLLAACHFLMVSIGRSRQLERLILKKQIEPEVIVESEKDDLFTTH